MNRYGCCVIAACFWVSQAKALMPMGQWITPDQNPPLIWQQVTGISQQSDDIEALSDVNSQSGVDDGESSGRHLTLAPGKEARFLLEQGRFVRLGAVPGTAHLDQLEVQQSSDDAWFYPLSMSAASKAGDIVSLQPVSGDRVIRLHNPGDRELRIRVSEGEYRRVPDEVTWQPQAVEQLPESILRRYPQSALQPVYHINHTQPHQLTLEGPGLYALSLRKTMNTLSQHRRSRLSVAIDGQAPEVHYLHFSPDRRHRYELGGKSLIVSQAERYYLWVAGGEHEVSLRSDQDVWLEVLRAEHHRSTSTGSDRAWSDTLTEVRERLLFQQEQTQWALRQLLVEGASAAELTAASFDTSGLDGWQQGYLDSLFRDRYIQQRSLWPDAGVPQIPLTELTTELHLTDRDDLYVVAAEKAGDAREAYFSVGSEPLNLPLPQTQGPARLRLRLTHPEQASTLTVEYGSRQHLLRYDPGLLTNKDQLRLTAVAQARKQTPATTTRRVVSEVALPLPEGISHVRLRTDGSAAEVRATVEEGRWPEFTEQEFWDYLTDLGVEAFFGSWKPRVNGEVSNDTAIPLDTARLTRDGQFLRDWLNSRYQNFIEDLSPPLADVPSRRVRANLASLFASDESALARRYAEGVFAFAEDSDARQEAFVHLKRMHVANDHGYALESLLATAFLHHDDVSVLPELATILERAGYDEAALKLALVLLKPGRLGPLQTELRQLALRTAVRAGWPLTLHRLSLSLPEAEQKAWRDFYLLERIGQIDAAFAEHSHHPVTDFYNALPAPNTVTAENWLAWFRRDYPGAWRWQDWPLEFRGAVEQVNVLNPDLNRFYQRQRVSPDQPLQMTVRGPVRLRLNTALLHADRYSRLNDQLRVVYDGTDYRFPMINSGVFNRHRIVGDDEYWPGNVETVEVTLGPGLHDLAIAATRYPALVNVELSTPDFLADVYVAAQLTACHPPATEALPRVGERALPVQLELVAPDWAANTRFHRAGCESFLTVSEDRLSVADEDRPVMQAFLSAQDVRFSPAPMVARETSEPLSPSRAQSREQVSRYLSEVLATPGFGRRSGLIARSNALAAQFPDDREIQRKRTAINVEQAWGREDLVIESAGIQQFDSADWLPSLPYYRNRYPLLGERRAQSEQLMSGPDPLLVAVDRGDGRQLRVSARLDKVGYERVSPVELDIRVNGDRVRQITLSETHIRQQVPLTLPAGSSQIELRLLNPTSRHWVYLQLEQRPDRNQPWQPVQPEQLRRYHAVLPDQPLILYVDRPAWVRFEVFDGQTRTQQYRYHPAAGELVVSASDLDGDYVRVYSLQHQPGRLTAQPHSSTPALAPQPERPTQRANAVVPRALLSDRLPMPQREDGTHGAYIDGVQRRNFDGASKELLERFVEVGWRYQQRPLYSRFYWQSDAFARQHTSEDITVVGTQQWLTWRPDNRYWRLNMMGGGFWQVGDSAGSLNLRASFNSRVPVASNWSVEHELTAFGHYLTESTSASAATSYDDNVFTNYKSNHRYGVALTESISFRPWRDSRFWLDGHLRSNEDLSPDRLAVALRWDQFWLKSVRTYLGIEQRWLQADDDRSDSASQQILGAGVEWHVWQNRGWRWFARLDTGFDLDASDPSLKLSLGMDAPGTKRFEDVRQERFPFFEFREMDAARSVDTNELNYVE